MKARSFPKILLFVIATPAPPYPSAHHNLTGGYLCSHEAAATEHCESVRHILTSVRDAHLTIMDGKYIDYEQLNQILITLNGEVERATKNALQRPEQDGKMEGPFSCSGLRGLQLSFGEIFAVTDDNLLIPVTMNLANFAPESTFVGLIAYDKRGNAKARITGKRLEWRPGFTYYLRAPEPGYFTLYFRTDKGRLRPSKNAIMLRWADVKDRIAYDLSDNKRQEDFEREDRARREVEAQSSRGSN